MNKIQERLNLLILIRDIVAQERRYDPTINFMGVDMDVLEGEIQILEERLK